jgi:hypothetical protein
MSDKEVPEEVQQTLSGLPEWMQRMIPQFSAEFDKLCVEVHESNHEPEQWLENDTLEQALHDLAFLANNARYTYMRVRLTQERLKRQVGEEVATQDFRKDL